MAQSKASSNATTDHEEIIRWAEERGGKPACVRGTGGKGDIGMLRLEFPGKPGANDDKLEPISWDDFFEKFDERGLALVLQEQTADGQKSNFNKLVSRETVEEKKAGAAGSRSKAGSKRTPAKSGGAKSSGSKSSAAKSSGAKSSAKTTGGASKSASASAAGKSRSNASGKSASRGSKAGKTRSAGR